MIDLLVTIILSGVACIVSVFALIVGATFLSMLPQDFFDRRRK